MLLWLPLSHDFALSYIDALFTSASAVTLTGAAVVPVAEFTVFGQVVILVLVQIGGLGIMTLAAVLFMLLGRRFAMRDRMVMQESLGEDTNQGIVKLTRRVVVFALVTEAAGAVLLLYPFIAAEGAHGIFTAVFTAVSAFCNAGFTICTGGVSLSAYAGNPLVLLTVALLAVLGGLGFVVVLDIGSRRGDFKRCRLHTKVVLTASLALLALGTAIFFAAEYSMPETLGGMSFGGKLMNAFFHSVNCRTAGFTTFDVAALTPASKMFTMILMFVGGSPGSAAGGIKVTVMVAVICIFLAELRRKDEIVMFKRTVSRDTCFRAAAGFFAGVLCVISLAFILFFTEKGALTAAGLYSGFDLVFESVSIFSTTGFDVGLVPHFSVVGKIVCVFVMFMGKIGVISFGAAFLKSVDGDEKLRYPEDTLLIG